MYVRQCYKLKYVFLHRKKRLIIVLKFLHFRLAELTAKDKEKKLLEMAKNDLEAFIYDMSDKLNDEDHEKCSTATEREEYSKLLAEAGEWMYEQEEDAKKEVIIQIRIKESQFIQQCRGEPTDIQRFCLHRCFAIS